MGDLVRLELGAAEGVAIVRLDRPPMNAIDVPLLDELDGALAEVRANPEIRAVLIWGGPKIFAAGADVKAFAEFGPAEASDLSTRLNGSFSRLAALPQVTIAAVCGFALGGGCELAMSADLRVMAEDARFGQPEILLGIIPGAGGTQRLSRLVGLGRAKELVLSGRQVDSDEALRIGLANAVHPAAEIYERSLELAAGYAAGPAALSRAKAAIDAGWDLSLAEALELEAREFGASFGTTDARIGIASFLENGPGKAEFSGT